MCVLALAWRAHPRWPLVLAGNRDEFHDRAADPLMPWADDPAILAGRDARAGGTWLGVSRAGRLAVLTNLRDRPAPPDAPSRGALVTDALRGALPDPAAAARYAGFNLLSVADGAARLVTNHPRGEARDLAPGLHGSSNGPFDARWPKTDRLIGHLAAWLTGPADDPGALFTALADDRDAPPAADLAHEPPGRIFIRDPVYGTRCSTVVAVDSVGRGTIGERSFDGDGAETLRNTLTFQWNAAP